MSRKKKPRGRKKKRNPGWFKKGHDARRYRFTPSDCRIGWWVANIRHPELRDWLRVRLYVFYSRKEKQHGKEEADGRAPGGGPAAPGGERDDDAGDDHGAGDDLPF